MMSKTKAYILLVEDDENLGFILKDYLELLDYEVNLQKNGALGYEAFRNNTFDLCILDVMLPVKDGFSLAEDIRKTNTAIPIVFLTAKSMKEDRIKGFKLGADDYITKPFSTEELSLRIEAIMKRVRPAGNAAKKENIYHVGAFTFDYSNMLLSSPAGEKHLTKREADVLQMLCSHKNQVLKREDALKAIWGENDYFMGRSMDVYITKLRKYFKDDPTISIINVHSTGFKLEVKE